MDDAPRVRKRALLAAAAGGLSSLGGCSALSEDDPERFRFGWIRLVNFSDERVRFHLLVEASGSVVHDERYRTGPVEGDVADGVTLTEAWMDTEDRYSVSVSALDQERTVTAVELFRMLASEQSIDRPCAELQFQVSPSGSLESYGGLEDGCDDADSN